MLPLLLSRRILAKLREIARKLARLVSSLLLVLPRRVSPRSFSTVADTSITAALKSLPKVPVRAASSSKRGRKYFWLI